MYRFVKNGKILSSEIEPTFIHVQSNKVIVPCDEKEAVGVKIGDEIFHILGRAPLEGHWEDITMCVISEDDFHAENEAVVASLEDAMCSQDALATQKQAENDKHIADIEDVLCNQDAKIATLSNK